MQQNGEIMDKVKIVYTSNAGVLVNHMGVKVMTDGIHAEGIKGYDNVSGVSIEKIIAGENGFADINFILVTHHHLDHISEKEMIMYLQNNTTDMVILPHSERKQIKETADFLRENNRQFQLLNMDYGDTKKIVTEKAVISALRTQHGGRFRDIQNYSYHINIGDKSFLHLGDAGYNDPNLSKFLMSKKTDIAFLNYDFLINKKGINLICDIIRPEIVFPVHIPLKDERIKKLIIKKTHHEKSNFPEIVFFNRELEETII